MAPCAKAVWFREVVLTLLAQLHFTEHCWLKEEGHDFGFGVRVCVFLPSRRVRCLKNTSLSQRIVSNTLPKICGRSPLEQHRFV